MAEYLVLIHAGEDELAPAETKARVEAHAAYEQKLREAAAFLDGERLRPSREGRRVSLRDGEPRVEAGPFPEKPLSAYCAITAETLSSAMELALDCPLGPGDELEVRPRMKGNLAPEKSNQPGRIFAFAVLGNAPNEEAWIDVMDRIDESTSRNFPTDRFLGGVRLQPPATGRRVTSTGGRRVTFDGPFLESKEVIGGLFFMRMVDLDEAARWVSRSAFIAHGTVEIRELWRS